MSERDLIDELLQAKVKSKLFGAHHAPRIGRLLIVEPLGSGGMGTVFAAYDPTLERKVAVKLLRGGRATSARVLREARALGKLNHPNVVAVHDATETDGVICIVMELAPGESLRRWIGAGKPWREVLEVMQQVAEGLCAAHRAGIVHRDVKPDNVVIGPDRVRLVDFGLASSRADATSEDGLEGAGTPSYLAPEVLGGAPADEASDQFSFGVTLFEALYGARPYEGKSRGELEARAARAAEAPAARDRRVPGWLHRVVTRALAGDPGARFPSMEVLARELGRDRRRRLQAGVTLATLVILSAAALAFGYHRGATRDVCGDGRARVAAAFSEARIAEMRARLGEGPWARKSVDDLSGLAREWVESHRRVCEATRVQGGQPESLFELRMRCLDRRFERMSALGSALVDELEPEARENVGGAVLALPRPERCESLVDASELTLPDEPELRLRVRRLEQELDAAWAAYALGRYRDAQKRAAQLERDTKDLHFAPFRAQLLLLAGSSEARVGSASVAREQLHAALAEAAAAHAASTEVEVWLRLLRGELFDGNPARVVEWAPFARAAAARAVSGNAEIDGIEAEALRDSGDLGRARSLSKHALASGEELRGDQRALLEMNLGSVELASGAPVAAERAFTRAFELAETALGKGHPGLGLHLDKLATAARDRGRIAVALEQHERALALRRAVYGSEDRAVATTLLRRAQTRIAAGKIAAAERDLEKARAIRARVHGQEHRRLGEVDLARGDAARARGDRAGAIALYESSAKLDPRLETTLRLAALGVTIDERALGEASPGAELSVVGAAMRASRVERLLARGDDEAALREARDLLSAWNAQKNDVSPALSISVASALQAVGRRVQAAEVYAAALAALSNEPSLPRLRSQSGLAECGEGPAAKTAAQEALRLLDAMPELDGSPRAALLRIAER